jgi:hypothetical protein
MVSGRDQARLERCKSKRGRYELAWEGERCPDVDAKKCLHILTGLYYN